MTVKKLEQPPNRNMYIWEHGCPFCIMVWKALEMERLNNKLEPKDRIIPVYVKQLGANYSTTKRVMPEIEGTPTLILGKNMISGVTTISYIKKWLEEWFSEDVLPWMG